MTPVIIAQSCALNAKEDYSRCHVMDYRSFMYVRLWMFPCHLSGNAMGNHFNLICVCVACAHCGAYQCVRKSKHTAPYSVFLSQLADSHSIAGGREEPQLLSDVNAAQTLCLCGHSPSDSSNQLMGYLTLPSSPLKHTSAELLWLVMGVTDKPKCLLRTH